MKRLFSVAIIIIAGSLAFSSAVSDWIGLGINLVDTIVDASSPSGDPIDNAASKAHEAALALDAVQRDEYYKDNKVNVTGAVFSSLFLGFGIAQDAMGDRTGSAWIRPLDIIGMSGAVTVGCFYLFSYLFTAPWYQNVPESGTLFDTEFGRLCMWTGLGCLGLSAVMRIIGSIRSITWGNRYNAAIRQALDLDVAFVPFISEDHSAGIQLSAKVSF